MTGLVRQHTQQLVVVPRQAHECVGDHDRAGGQGHGIGADRVALPELQPVLIPIRGGEQAVERRRDLALALVREVARLECIVVEDRQRLIADGDDRRYETIGAMNAGFVVLSLVVGLPPPPNQEA